MCGTVSLGAPRSLWAGAAQPQQVLLTWMSVTNWLFEIGNTRILMDGYITRIPEAAFSGVGFATATPTKPDEPAIRRLIDALGACGDGLIDIADDDCVPDAFSMKSGSLTFPPKAGKDQILSNSCRGPRT